MAVSTQQSNRELRRAMRGRRSGLAGELVDGWSAAIAGRLTRLELWAEASVVHCYVGSLPGEVRTGSLIASAWAEGRCVQCPRVRPHGQLEHHEVSEREQLAASAFGLLEPDPERAPPADPSAADLIIVPGVAFDARGARLGMGGGYYDRFLAECSAPTVGLAFEMQLLDEIPQAAHDRSVGVIVTELRVIQCR